MLSTPRFGIQRTMFSAEQTLLHRSQNNSFRLTSRRVWLSVSWALGVREKHHLLTLLVRTYKAPASRFSTSTRGCLAGAEQLVGFFFVELSAQLKVRPGFSEVGRSLEDYGETFAGMSWLPLVGPWMERARVAMSILAKLLQRRKEGVGGRRIKVEKALAALDRPIVVVVDDIDRLTTSEIRDIFKLVRLTANFPNVIYIAAFDRGSGRKSINRTGNPLAGTISRRFCSWASTSQQCQRTY